MEQTLSRLTSFSLETLSKMSTGYSLTYQRCMADCPVGKSKFLFLMDYLLSKYSRQLNDELDSLVQTKVTVQTDIATLKNKLSDLPNLSIEQKRKMLTLDILENREILEDVAHQTSKYMVDLSETINEAKAHKDLAEQFPAIKTLYDSITQSMESNISVVSVMDSRFSGQLQGLADAEKMSDTEVEFKTELKINYIKELLSTQETNLAEIDNNILNRSKDLELIENVRIKLNQ